MTKSLTSSVVAVVLLLIASLVVSGPAWPSWIVGVVGGLVLAVGAWCAPLFTAGRPLAGTWFTRWSPAWDTPKSAQVLSGGIAAAALVLVRLFDVGAAVAVGIVVAVVVGAFLPSAGTGTAPAGARRP